MSAATSNKPSPLNYQLIMNLTKMTEKDSVGNRWSKQEIQIFQESLQSNTKEGGQPNLKIILVDLIEEDFTSRAFDNIKALHALAKVVLAHYNQFGSDKLSEDDFIVSHLDAFFKYRNKVSELEQMAGAQQQQQQSLQGQQPLQVVYQQDQGQYPPPIRPSAVNPEHPQQVQQQQLYHQQQQYKQGTPSSSHQSRGGAAEYIVGSGAGAGEYQAQFSSGTRVTPAEQQQIRYISRQQQLIQQQPANSFANGDRRQQLTTQQQPQQQYASHHRVPFNHGQQVQQEKDEESVESGAMGDLQQPQQSRRPSQQNTGNLQLQQQFSRSAEQGNRSRSRLSGMDGPATSSQQFYDQMMAKKHGIQPSMMQRAGGQQQQMPQPQRGIRQIEETNFEMRGREIFQTSQQQPMPTQEQQNEYGIFSRGQQGRRILQQQPTIASGAQAPLSVKGARLDQEVQSYYSKIAPGKDHREQITGVQQIHGSQQPQKQLLATDQQQQQMVQTQPNSTPQYVVAERVYKDIALDQIQRLHGSGGSGGAGQHTPTGPDAEEDSNQQQQHLAVARLKQQLFSHSDQKQVGASGSILGQRLQNQVAVDSQSDRMQSIAQQHRITYGQQMPPQVNNKNNDLELLQQQQQMLPSDQAEKSQIYQFFESMNDVIYSKPDPNMAFLDKSRPGPKIGQRRSNQQFQSPTTSARPPTKSQQTTFNQSEEKQQRIVGQQLMRMKSAGTPDKVLMPSNQVQRRYMNQFLNTLIDKQKLQSVALANSPKNLNKGDDQIKRGIGFLLKQVTDNSQIIPDERPVDDPQVLMSENPENVLQIKNLFSPKSLRWFKCEYFYSFIDKPFFQENELMETLNEAGMPTELNQREWGIIRQSLFETPKNRSSKKAGSRPRRLFSAQFIADEKRKLERYRYIFRAILNQYQVQQVYQNVKTGKLSDFELDTAQLLQDNYTEEEIEHTLKLVQKSKVLPLQVSQQVLAMHPQTRELRTASLLTTFDNKYHVQYHNPELGVHVQKDTQIVPIGPSELYRSLENNQLEQNEDQPEPEATKENYVDEYGRPLQNVPINTARNQLLANVQLAGNQQLVQTLLSQVEEGTRQKSFLSVDQTEYTNDNKKAMALLLMLIERKDFITQRLSELEQITVQLREVAYQKKDQPLTLPVQDGDQDASVENELKLKMFLKQKDIEEAQVSLWQTDNERGWLLRHLQLTNEAIVPVLNVTRLKHVKNSPFTDKSDEAQQNNMVDMQEGGKHNDNEQNEEFKDQQQQSTSAAHRIVDILELSGQRKVCKPVVELENHKGFESSSGITQVVQEIAKLLEQFYDVQVVIESKQSADADAGDNAIAREASPGANLEDDLAIHKDMILKSLAQLNITNLESLLNILEEKTRTHISTGEEVNKNGASVVQQQQRLADLMQALRKEISRVLEKVTEPLMLTEENNVVAHDGDTPMNQVGLSKQQNNGGVVAASNNGAQQQQFQNVSDQNGDQIAVEKQ